MTKRIARKKAHKSIFKDGNSHKETFENLRNNYQDGPDDLAEILTLIPSQSLHERTKNLWIPYVVLLGIIALLRIYTIILFGMLNVIRSPEMLILAGLIGILVPIWGIVGVLNGWHSSVRTVPMLIVLSTVRGILDAKGNFHPEHFIGIGIVATLGILALVLIKKWKTPYSKTIKVVETNGMSKKRLDFVFTEAPKTDGQLLDEEL